MIKLFSRYRNMTHLSRSTKYLTRHTAMICKLLEVSMCCEKHFVKFGQPKYWAAEDIVYPVYSGMLKNNDGSMLDLNFVVLC